MQSINMPEANMSPVSRTAFQFTLTSEANERLDALVSSGFAPNRSFAVEMLILGVDEGSDEESEAPAGTKPAATSWLDGTWDEHLARILTQHGKRSTTGHTILITGPGSYEAEYKACRDAFGDGETSFASIDLEGRMLIAGTGGGSNGFFGNMRPAVPFRPVVEKASGATSIAESLDLIPFKKKDGVALNDLREILTGLVSIRGLGLGTATRLLAVKRPDQFLPVNGANLEHVCARIRRVRSDSPAHRVGDYVDLIAAIRDTEWFNSPAPSKGTEGRWIWFARVAMLDARLYAVKA
jgi:hypothetical protein